MISENTKDRDFWRGIAAKTGFTFEQVSGEPAIEAYLSANPSAFVFWDAGSSDRVKEMEALLARKVPNAQVFAITDDPINRHEELSTPPAYGHHIYRRYEGPAPFLYQKLLESATADDPSGLLRYFPDQGTTHETVQIKEAFDKRVALGKIEAFLESSGVPSKITSIGLDACDELIMNGIFDAPYAEGRGHYRREVDRAENFPLEKHEEVMVTVASCPEFIGMSVRDPFGSLKRDSILRHLIQNYREDEYTLTEGKSAGLGLHRINQLAMALLFVSRPGRYTEVMVFFSNTKTYKEFRLGFCFFSIFSE